MTESTSRSRMGRGVAVLAIVALGALAISPAYSAFNPTKGKIKKIAQKQVKKVGRDLFIEEAELVRYGPVTVNLGASQQVASIGPFTFTAACEIADDADPGTDPDPLNAVQYIDTSEDNSAFNSDDDSEDDFDAADPAEEWAEDAGNEPETGDPVDVSDDDDGIMHAYSPSGTAIEGQAMALSNHATDTCTFWGSFLHLT